MTYLKNMTAKDLVSWADDQAARGLADELVKASKSFPADNWRRVYLAFRGAAVRQRLEGRINAAMTNEARAERYLSIFTVTLVDLVDKDA